MKTIPQYKYAKASDESALRKILVRGPIRKWSISGNVTIGYHSNINGPVNARGQVEIGMFCALGRDVSLLSSNHNTRLFNQHIGLQRELGFKRGTISKGRIVVGHNVWIGDKATILSGVTIGHGAVIAANAVVVNNVAPFEVVAGVPAKHLRYRFSPCVISQLLQIEWWHWPHEKMKKNKSFFELELNEIDEIDIMHLIV